MYYAKRIGQSILVFLIAVTVTFALYRMLPFGPVEMLKIQLMQQFIEQGSSPTPEQMAKINGMVQTYTGIDPSQPWYISYYEYIRDIVLYQDFGRSIFKQEPVFTILFKAMPWSIFISIYGLALGTTVSLLLGAGMAYTEGSRFDTGLTIFSIINTTVPYYVVAILTLIIFSFNLGWFPSGGRMDPATTPGINLPFIIGVVKHAALPVFSSFIAGFGGALAFRGNCIREMGEGYIRVAQLRGISKGRIAIRYVGRNALLPVYTSIMMGLAGLFGSSIILETIFNYPAMGYVTFNALLNRDYPLIMGAFIFFTAITLLGILVADLTYGIIDPRVKGGSNREAY
ncbi:ABC transporter permease [Haloprofundus marisrubri]|uniref:ABC transporter permease n=1 Tax=Haloprofundus marisrubri TaxID=1514971 RepID=A0A0W1RDF2_9EURY|nr:ABC transporter permease [Haloprofundus marisrubri]KTG11468.1 ABC transporter permease [Haloprofundus marisrubri]